MVDVATNSAQRTLAIRHRCLSGAIGLRAGVSDIEDDRARRHHDGADVTRFPVASLGASLVAEVLIASMDSTDEGEHALGQVFAGIGRSHTTFPLRYRDRIVGGICLTAPHGSARPRSVLAPSDLDLAAWALAPDELMHPVERLDFGQLGRWCAAALDVTEHDTWVARRPNDWYAVRECGLERIDRLEVASLDLDRVIEALLVDRRSADAGGPTLAVPTLTAGPICMGTDVVGVWVRRRRDRRASVDAHLRIVDAAIADLERIAHRSTAARHEDAVRRWLGDVASEPLTEREHQVVRLVLGGARVPSIARDLYLSEHTVRNTLRSACRRLGLPSQAALAESFLRSRDGVHT